MIKAGTATQVINNEIGTYVQAAGHKKTVTYIRDNLEANALWLQTDADGLLFISCDLAALDMDYVKDILPEIARAAGIAKEKIILGCTHTHSGPSVIGPTDPDKPLDEAYLARLKDWLCQIANKAVHSAEPVKVAWGAGEAQIGFNRRVCYADGSHQMHGDPARPDFTGLEGPVPSRQHIALFVKDLVGNLKAILHHNTAHPITFYGADFLSADFPGLSRAHLREVFGDISVLFFNGALGDVSLINECCKKQSPETSLQQLSRAAHLVTGQTLRILQQAEFEDDIHLAHTHRRYDVLLRSLPEERLRWARKVMADDKAGRKSSTHLELPTAFLTLLLHERFGGREHETIDLHVGCIDGFAFATVPCELFSHFALQVMRRSPFSATAIFGLINGDMGYCPTFEGVMGGSWEGTVALSSRWDLSAGYKIVDEACKLLSGLANESNRCDDVASQTVPKACH